MDSDKHRAVFERHLPDKAVVYCFELWSELKFNFKITPNRKSKFGDYKYDPNIDLHTISVNGSLNPYAFLVTYIHEVAHKATYDRYQNKVNPHGQEWKYEFKKLMIPMLKEDVFPMDILSPLALHMKNPKATSVSDPKLFEALSSHNPPTTDILLKNIPLGSHFLFRNKVYKKIDVRRTRALCEAISIKKQYLISQSAPVQKFKNK